MGRGRGRPKKEERDKIKIKILDVHIPREMGRKKWLKEHPEDIPLDEENQMARLKGYDNDGLRSLMAAMCLRVIFDYKKAIDERLINIDGKLMPVTQKVISNCEEAFTDDLFAFFTNGMKPEEIMRIIRETPKEELFNIGYILGKQRESESQKIQRLL